MFRKSFRLIAVDTTPKAVTIGNAKIIADQRANSIIVLGNREVVVKVQKILDEMDVSAPQVALATVIGEFTLNNAEETGIDYFVKYKNKVVGTVNNDNRDRVPIPLPTVAAAASPGGTPVFGGVIDPGNLINFSQIIQNVASGTNVYIAAGNYLSEIVHLLETTRRFRVISRPMVFTSNNKKAIIASGHGNSRSGEHVVESATIGITGVDCGQQIECRIQESGAST